MNSSKESRRKIVSPEKEECEVMYVVASPSEHLEEYLEALWLIEEAGNRRAKVSNVSQRLSVSPPSAVQMLRRLERERYLQYIPRSGVQLTSRGREIGKRMVRNGRLMEVFMRSALHIEVDGKAACGIEHHLSEEFADGLCTLLKHPRSCPHDLPIPLGMCCKLTK